MAERSQRRPNVVMKSAWGSDDPIKEHRRKRDGDSPATSST